MEVSTVIAPLRQPGTKQRWKALWRSALFSSTRLWSKNLISGCTCRLFIPVCTGNGSGMQNPLANFIGVFSLVRDDRGFQENPLCHHDITRSDRQIGNGRSPGTGLGTPDVDGSNLGSSPGISNPAPEELLACRLQFQPCSNTSACSYQVALKTLIKVQGFFICHIINYTGYNQKWNVDQIRSAQWAVQKNKNYIKVTQHKSIYIGKKEK